MLGASFDSLPDQAAFAAKFSFPFLLLSDATKRLAQDYKAAASPADAWPRRVTYLIGADGRIEQAIETKDPAGQAAAVLELVRSA